MLRATIHPFPVPHAVPHRIAWLPIGVSWRQLVQLGSEALDKALIQIALLAVEGCNWRQLAPTGHHPCAA